MTDDEPLDDTPPEEEIDMAVEEALGHAIDGDPAERIEAITKRIAYLENQLREYLNLEASPANQSITDLIKAHLGEARVQLEEWKHQQKARN